MPIERNISNAGLVKSPDTVRPVKDLTPMVIPPAEDQVVKMTFPDGKEIELPILKGTEGAPMIDI